MCVEQIPVRFPELAIDNERDENVSRGGNMTGNEVFYSSANFLPLISVVCLIFDGFLLGPTRWFP
jgi:hypothetical protein